MYNEERVSEYIKEGKKLLEDHEGSEDTADMKRLAEEICDYFADDVPEFKRWSNKWEPSPTRLHLVISKLEDWKKSYEKNGEIMVSSI